MTTTTTLTAPTTRPATGARPSLAEAVAHTGWVTMRHLRALARQPWYVAITLVQPVLWLVLFGSLFQRVVDVPGFGGAGDAGYVTFLVPGIVVMSALFSGAWAGMTIVQDDERGLLTRFLVTPASRAALIIGQLAQLAVVMVVQTVIVLGLGALLGADYPGGLAGLAGIATLLGTSVLTGTALGALSQAVALLARQEETIIGVSQFLVLPLALLSSVYLPTALAPGWIASFARYNPVTWAADASRDALSAGADWGAIGLRAAGLAAVTALCAGAATRAFRAYTRSA